MTALSRALHRSGSILAAELDSARRGDAKAIHRTRVATRRLREALAVVEGVKEIDPDVRALKSDLRKVTAALGPVREMDVSRRVLKNLAEAEGWPAVAVAIVDQHCLDRRSDLTERLATELDDVTPKKLGTRLRATARSIRHADSALLNRTLGSRLAGRSRDYDRAVRAAGIVYAADRLHRVRIAAKKLRYVSEVVDGAAPDGLRRLKRLQKLLGHLHDAQIVQHRILEASATQRGVGLFQAFGEMSRDIDADCRRWHAKALPLMLGPRALARPVRMEAVRKRRTA